MRGIIWTALACCCLSFSMGEETADPFPRSPEDTTAKSDPAAQELLERWSKHNPPSERVSVSFFLRTYDQIFQVETLASGSLEFAHPQQWKIELRPVAITPAMLAARNKPDARVKCGPDGRPYKLESMLPAILIPRALIRDGDLLLTCSGSLGDISLQDIERRLTPNEVAELPFWELFAYEFGASLRLQHDSPPLLFLRRPEQILAKCDIEILDQQTSVAGQLHLRAFPKSHEQQIRWKSAKMIVDSATWRPTHARITHLSGTKEDVYSFHGWEE